MRLLHVFSSATDRNSTSTRLIPRLTQYMPTAVCHGDAHPTLLRLQHHAMLQSMHAAFPCVHTASVQFNQVDSCEIMVIVFLDISLFAFFFFFSSPNCSCCVFAGCVLVAAARTRTAAGGSLTLPAWTRSGPRRVPIRSRKKPLLWETERVG